MKKAKISDLIPDDRNYNKGTEFGNSLINKSIKKFGAGRSNITVVYERLVPNNIMHNALKPENNQRRYFTVQYGNSMTDYTPDEFFDKFKILI